MIDKITRMLICVAVMLILACIYLYQEIRLDNERTLSAKNQRVQKIFLNLVKKTGIGNEIPNLTLLDNNIVNAYANNSGIYLYTGLLDMTKNDDEIAMVLGYEIAHVSLLHVYIKGKVTDLDIQHMEANADKMGAFYLVSSGYNICKARNLWLRMADKRGDYLGMDHPNYAYRYTQLNVQCGD